MRRRLAEKLLAVLCMATLVLALLPAAPAYALSYNEQVLARELAWHGFGNVQIAAIIGNTVGESGCDPTLDYDLSGQFRWPYEWGCGLFGYTDCGTDAEHLSVAHRTQLKTWALEHNYDWATIEAQVEFTFGASGGLSWRDDWMSGLAESGYYWGFSNVPQNMEYDPTPDAFLAETRLDVATYSWMACYGRGSDIGNHYADGLNAENSGRLGEAMRVLAELDSGAYAEFMATWPGIIPEARPEQVAELSAYHEPTAPAAGVQYVPISDPAPQDVDPSELLGAAANVGEATDAAEHIGRIRSSTKEAEEAEAEAGADAKAAEARKNAPQLDNGPFIAACVLATLMLVAAAYILARTRRNLPLVPAWLTTLAERSGRTPHAHDM